MDLILYDDDYDKIVYDKYVADGKRNIPIVKCSKCHDEFLFELMSIIDINQVFEGLGNNKILHICIGCEIKICDRLERFVSDLREHIPFREKYNAKVSQLNE